MPVSPVLVGVGKAGGPVGFVLHWVMGGISYDLGAWAGSTICPGVLSPSSDTHTSVPSSRSGRGRT